MSAAAIAAEGAELLLKAAKEHPEVARELVGLLRDILARRDPMTQAKWHATIAAHSLATEKALDESGVL